MCHYITATLPHDVNLDAVAPVFESHRLGFALISNPHVSSQIEPGGWYILTTKGHCDCGTALGSLNRPAAGEAVSHERELRKLRKRGWSEARVRRWIEQKELAEAKRLREADARGLGAAPEVERWMSCLADLLRSGHTRRVGLLLHMYRGGVASERIDIPGREEIGLAELTPDRLRRMREDVAYVFVA